MTQVKMPSNIVFKLKNGQPYDVTPVFSSSGAGIAYYLEGKLVIKLTTGINTGHYVQIPTPFGFTVRDVRVRNDGAQSSTITVSNAGTEIVAAITIAANEDIDRAVKLDDTDPSFIKGDDDLRFAIGGTGPFVGVIEVAIEPAVS